MSIPPFNPFIVKIIDNLSDKKKDCDAKNYGLFGAEQVHKINEEVFEWLNQQAFASEAPDPRFNQLEISGDSDAKDHRGKDEPDTVCWELYFKEPLIKRLKSTLGDKLLHIKRWPEIRAYNSEPDLLNTEDYIKISVSNTERGWVKKGLFPKNTHIDTETEFSDSMWNPKIKEIPFAVFTDIKRDAQAGFYAAKEWSKFRTMAIASSKYLIDILEEEEKEIQRIEDHSIRFRKNDSLRKKKGFVTGLMLDLLPDTRIQKGIITLPEIYQPGILETITALELEKGTDEQRYGKCKTPIYHINGVPIEIIPVPGKEIAYNAKISFTIHPSGGVVNHEIAKKTIEESLQRYFDVILTDKNDLKFSLLLENAQNIRSKISEGAENTPLHTNLRNIVEAISLVSETNGLWTKEQQPVLEEGYRAMVNAGMKKHFERIENNLPAITIPKEYRHK
ncbi:MAG: hypothetical protein PHE43_00445 [Candidatus Nanoarchaeia archaeon]|nr:hypothetical protein [Candidatus Nanoarchaeia archaeon]